MSLTTYDTHCPSRVAQTGRQAALMRTPGIIDEIQTHLRETGYRRCYVCIWWLTS